MKNHQRWGLLFAVLLTVGCGSGSSSNSSNNNNNNGGNNSGGIPPDQTARFRITNQCQYPIWVQQNNMPAGVPPITSLASGAFVDFDIPAAGLASTRFWAKLGCDSNGENCRIGQSLAPCPAVGCAPPVDSKIEVTWGCTLPQAQCALTPQGQPIGATFYNSSAVDGFTFPFSVTVDTGGGADCVNLDCSSLELNECPTNENLSQGQSQTHPQYASVNLAVVDPAQPATPSGCFSPCKYLDYPGWGGAGLQNEQSDAEVMYCCPTPPISSGACRAGPVANTEYVALIHQHCNGGVYGYAYDDGVGLHSCAAATKIHMSFGPNCP